MCLTEYCFFWPSEVRTVAYASYADQSNVSAAFHQIQSKPGVTNCTQKVLQDIKILWDRENSILTTKANIGVLSCFCHSVSVYIVQMLLNSSTKQTIPITFQNPIAFMNTECKKLFLQAMTAITTTVLNKKVLASHRNYQNLNLHLDITETNESDKLWNITQHFPGKMLANTEKLVWIHKVTFFVLFPCFILNQQGPSDSTWGKPTPKLEHFLSPPGICPLWSRCTWLMTKSCWGGRVKRDLPPILLCSSPEVRAHPGFPTRHPLQTRTAYRTVLAI